MAPVMQAFKMVFQVQKYLHDIDFTLEKIQK